jgi:hypothetical protein
MIKIDKRLNLVLEVQRDDGTSVYVHSVPIGKEVYEANFRLITRTAVGMYSDGLAPGACARIAALAMRATAKDMDGSSGDTHRRAAESLLQEVWRLTNILMPGLRGWETVPFHNVIQEKTLDDEQVSEVQNILAFFTVVSWFHRESERTDIYQMLRIYGAQTVSSNVTEYSASLPISIPGATTGATVLPSSTPL